MVMALARARPRLPVTQWVVAALRAARPKQARSGIGRHRRRQLCLVAIPPGSRL